MRPWMWILICLLLVVCVVGPLVLVRQWRAGRRRSARLQNTFGPEYDRAVRETDSRAAAERQLEDRARRRADVEIVPLREEARQQFAQQWRDIQVRFVDEPADALSRGHTLLRIVMTERGYPSQDDVAQVDLVSVDHPSLMNNYRIASAIHERSRAGSASTEELREALLCYRSLFEQLLAPPPIRPVGNAGGRHRSAGEDLL